jgi:hypothetical protein
MMVFGREDASARASYPPEGQSIPNIVNGKTVAGEREVTSARMQ